ncbi:MAG TPA: hypothetical protein VMU75_14820 [Acidimicrobiales bacterium]|jgi:hypothetical protein|nr:hypothetical protein [Acidimicrobiales bacterium]
MASAGLTISCDECAFEGTDTCDGCVVNFLLEHDPHDAVVIDAAEERAVRMLQRVGLVPELRHQRRVG